MKHNLILRVIAKFLFPVIALFAFYVQFHGDFGPGGGFQAGVILSVAFIFYALVFGLKTTEEVIPPQVLRVLASTGILIYAGTGITTMLMGGHFLDYNLLSLNPIQGQHIGIMVVEAGVGITVCSVMLMIFFAFAGRARLQETEHD
jgi:multicomponent Na+:H+ antiporter subunit B